MTDLIGKTLGKYQIVVRVGRGGMARVYKAYQASLDRYVAIKVLHTHLAEEGDFVKRFEREATGVARLRHPHIVQVFDYDKEEDLYYIVMEFVEGPTLKAEIAERLRRNEGLIDTPIFGVEEAARIFGALASAIDFAHSRGMIHRDIKPGNVMFTADGQVLLTDFGLARMIYSDKQTKTGALSGTPAYMAPEQVEGKRVDERSDVYSLAVVLYEMLTGRVPFTAETPYAIMSKHVTESVPPPSQFNKNLTEAVESVILKSLSKNPDRRYGSAGEFAASLEQALGIHPSPGLSEGLIAPIATMADGLDMMPYTTQVGREGTSTPGMIPSPYRGLFAFREEDAPYFFGRESFADRLTETLAKQSMVAVIGPSGSGKSSVVFAGLVPRLRSEERWEILTIRPGHQPFHALAGPLVSYLAPDATETQQLIEIKELASALADERLDLTDILSRLSDRDGPDRHYLLVVDQFEELYTLCPDETARRRFPNLLFKGVQTNNGDTGLSLVLTLRADFMGQALANRPFADALQETDVKLGPMNKAELGRAIESPAAKMGVIYEAGLVERILDDVGDEPGNLPLLEFALTLLWDRRSGRRLTHAGYDSIGRVEGSLARYADQVYEGLSVEEQDIARRVFTQMVRPGEGTEDTRRLATRDELRPEDWELVQKLADARLAVTGRTVEGLDTVEVVHEALIKGWGRLREWMEGERAFRAWQERFRISLRQWEDSSRDDGALLRGVPLGEAEDWLRKKNKDLSQAEKNYINESLALRERIVAEREERRKRELEAAQRLADEQKRRAEAEFERAETQARASRRLRALASILGLVFLIAVAAAVVAVSQSRDAAHQADARATEVVIRTTAQSEAVESAELAVTRAAESAAARVTAEAERFRANESAAEALSARDEAEAERDRADQQATLALSRQLAAESSALLVPQLDLALLLSLEAHNVYDSPETEGAILSGLQTMPRLYRYLHGDPKILQSVAFNPDESLLGVVGAEGHVLIWDLATGDEFIRLEGHDPSQLVNRIAFSPSGQLAATASDDTTIILWDIETGRPERQLREHTAWVQAVAFTPDGQGLVSGSGDRTVLLWDIDSGEIVRPLLGHSAPVWDVAVSNDGRHAASAAGDGEVIIWDLETGESLHSFVAHAGAAFNVEFSSDDQILATAGADGNIGLWNVVSGEAYSDPLVGHTAATLGLSFSPDGNSLLSGSIDSTVRLWDIRTSQQVQIAGNHNAAVNAVVFSESGDWAASVDGGGLTIVWDTSADGISFGRVINVDAAGVNNVSFRMGTGELLSAGVDGTIRRWDSDTGEQIGETITHSLKISISINSLAFSRSGSLLVSAGSNGTVASWDYKSGKMLTNTISALTGGVTSVSIESQDSMLAAGGVNGFASLWDFESGTQIGPFLAGHLGRVNSVLISPDGSMIASGSDDGTVIIRPVSEVQSGQVTSNPLTYTMVADTRVLSLAFDPMSQFLVSGDNHGQIVVWDAQTRVAVRQGVQLGTTPISKLAVSPDGHLLAIGDEGGVLLIQQLTDGEEIWRQEEVLGDQIQSMVFSDGGSTLTALDSSGGIATFQTQDGQLLSQRTIEHEGDYVSSILSSNGQLVALGYKNGDIQVKDLSESGTNYPHLNHSIPFLGQASAVTSSPDGSLIASAGFDGSVILWDAESGQPIGDPLLGHTGAVVNVVVSPDGRLIASSSCSRFHRFGNCLDGEVLIRDISTGNILHRLTDSGSFTQALAFSPDGLYLAANDCELVEVAGACLSGGAILWDVESGQVERKFIGHSSFVWSVAFSPNGRILATASADNTILLWDIASGGLLGQRLTNHGGAVRKVTFSPDGQRLASGGFDSLVFLWDVETGQAIGGPFTSHAGVVNDLLFNNDGRKLASASADGTIIIWDVDVESWRQQACRIANRNMRVQEWNQFLGSQRYRRTCPDR